MLSPAVLGTAVPEATVHKNGEPGPGENDVCLTLQRGEWTPVDVVAKATSMELATKSQLRAGVSSRQLAHPPMYSPA
jgi:hypothetical protein